jgi:hypothetical protein
MKRYALDVAFAMVIALGPSMAAGSEQGHVSHAAPPPPRLYEERNTERERQPEGETSVVTRGDSTRILVRPGTLATTIADLAGHSVRVPYARVVGVFNPRAFLIDTASRLPALPGNRGRVLVLVDPGALRVPAAAIVTSTVTVLGVARTLLGAQVTGEVAWPIELRPEVVERLEIRAAVLATSVQTPDGVELTAR